MKTEPKLKKSPKDPKLASKAARHAASQAIAHRKLRLPGKTAQIIFLSTMLISMPVLIWFVAQHDWKAVAATTGMGRTPKAKGEYSIGEFHEGNNSIPDVTLVVDMTLYADVGDGQGPQFHNILESRGTKLRSAVGGVLREAPYRDLMEPTLTTLKRKVKVALVQASGEETHVFDELIIPEFDTRRVN